MSSNSTDCEREQNQHFDIHSVCKRCAADDHWSKECRNERIFFCWICGQSNTKTTECCGASKDTNSSSASATKRIPYPNEPIYFDNKKGLCATIGFGYDLVLAKIDTSSFRSFIGELYANELGTPTNIFKANTFLTMQDGSERFFNEELRIKMKFGNWQGNMNFLINEDIKGHIVLGLDFLMLTNTKLTMCGVNVTLNQSEVFVNQELKPKVKDVATNTTIPQPLTATGNSTHMHQQEDFSNSYDNQQYALTWETAQTHWYAAGFNQQYPTTAVVSDNSFVNMHNNQAAIFSTSALRPKVDLSFKKYILPPDKWSPALIEFIRQCKIFQHEKSRDHLKRIHIIDGIYYRIILSKAISQPVVYCLGPALYVASNDVEQNVSNSSEQQTSQKTSQQDPYNTNAMFKRVLDPNFPRYVVPPTEWSAELKDIIAQIKVANKNAPRKKLRFNKIVGGQSYRVNTYTDGERVLVKCLGPVTYVPLTNNVATTSGTKSTDSIHCVDMDLGTDDEENSALNDLQVSTDSLNLNENNKLRRGEEDSIADSTISNEEFPLSKAQETLAAINDATLTVILENSNEPSPKIDVPQTSPLKIDNLQTEEISSDEEELVAANDNLNELSSISSDSDTADHFDDLSDAKVKRRNVLSSSPNIMLKRKRTDSFVDQVDCCTKIVRTNECRDVSATIENARSNKPSNKSIKSNVDEMPIDPEKSVIKNSTTSNEIVRTTTSIEQQYENHEILANSKKPTAAESKSRMTKNENQLDDQVENIASKVAIVAMNQNKSTKDKLAVKSSLEILSVEVLKPADITDVNSDKRESITTFGEENINKKISCRHYSSTTAIPCHSVRNQQTINDSDKSAAETVSSNLEPLVKADELKSHKESQQSINQNVLQSNTKAIKRRISKEHSLSASTNKFICCDTNSKKTSNNCSTLLELEEAKEPLLLVVENQNSNEIADGKAKENNINVTEKQYNNEVADDIIFLKASKSQLETICISDDVIVNDNYDNEKEKSKSSKDKQLSEKNYVRFLVPPEQYPADVIELMNEILKEPKWPRGVKKLVKEFNGITYFLKMRKPAYTEVYIHKYIRPFTNKSNKEETQNELLPLGYRKSRRRRRRKKNLTDAVDKDLEYELKSKAKTDEELLQKMVKNWIGADRRATENLKNTDDANEKVIFAKELDTTTDKRLITAEDQPKELKELLQQIRKNWTGLDKEKSFMRVFHGTAYFVNLHKEKGEEVYAQKWSNKTPQKCCNESQVASTSKAHKTVASDNFIAAGEQPQELSAKVVQNNIENPQAQHLAQQRITIVSTVAGNFKAADEQQQQELDAEVDNQPASTSRAAQRKTVVSTVGYDCLTTEEQYKEFQAKVEQYLNDKPTKLPFYFEHIINGSIYKATIESKDKVILELAKSSDTTTVPQHIDNIQSIVFKAKSFEPTLIESVHENSTNDIDVALSEMTEELCQLIQAVLPKEKRCLIKIIDGKTYRFVFSKNFKRILVQRKVFGENHTELSKSEWLNTKETSENCFIALTELTHQLIGKERIDINKANYEILKNIKSKKRNPTNKPRIFRQIINDDVYLIYMDSTCNCIEIDHLIFDKKDTSKELPDTPTVVNNNSYNIELNFEHYPFERQKPMLEIPMALNELPQHLNENIEKLRRNPTGKEVTFKQAIDGVGYAVRLYKSCKYLRVQRLIYADTVNDAAAKTSNVANDSSLYTKISKTAEEIIEKANKALQIPVKYCDNDNINKEQSFRVEEVAKEFAATEIQTADSPNIIALGISSITRKTSEKISNIETQQTNLSNTIGVGLQTAAKSISSRVSQETNQSNINVEPTNTTKKKAQTRFKSITPNAAAIKAFPLLTKNTTQVRNIFDNTKQFIDMPVSKYTTNNVKMIDTETKLDEPKIDRNRVKLLRRKSSTNKNSETLIEGFSAKKTEEWYVVEEDLQGLEMNKPQALAEDNSTREIQDANIMATELRSLIKTNSTAFTTRENEETNESNTNAMEPQNKTNNTAQTNVESTTFKLIVKAANTNEVFHVSRSKCTASIAEMPPAKTTLDELKKKHKKKLKKCLENQKDLAIEEHNIKNIKDTEKQTIITLDNNNEVLRIVLEDSNFWAKYSHLVEKDVVPLEQLPKKLYYEIDIHRKRTKRKSVSFRYATDGKFYSIIIDRRNRVKAWTLRFFGTILNTSSEICKKKTSNIDDIAEIESNGMQRNRKNSMTIVTVEYNGEVFHITLEDEEFWFKWKHLAHKEEIPASEVPIVLKDAIEAYKKRDENQQNISFRLCLNNEFFSVHIDENGSVRQGRIIFSCAILNISKTEDVLNKECSAKPCTFTSEKNSSNADMKAIEQIISNSTLETSSSTNEKIVEQTNLSNLFGKNLTDTEENDFLEEINNFFSSDAIRELLDTYPDNKVTGAEDVAKSIITGTDSITRNETMTGTEPIKITESIIRTQPTTGTEPLIDTQSKTEPIVRTESITATEPLTKTKSVVRTEPTTVIKPLKETEPTVKTVSMTGIGPLSGEVPIARTELITGIEPLTRTAGIITGITRTAPKSGFETNGSLNSIQASKAIEKSARILNSFEFKKPKDNTMQHTVNAQSITTDLVQQKDEDIEFNDEEEFISLNKFEALYANPIKKINLPAETVSTNQPSFVLPSKPLLKIRTPAEIAKLDTLSFVSGYYAKTESSIIGGKEQVDNVMQVDELLDESFPKPSTSNVRMISSDTGMKTRSQKSANDKQEIKRIKLNLKKQT